MAKRNEAANEEARVRDLPARHVRLTSDMSLPKLSAVEIGNIECADHIAVFENRNLVADLIYFLEPVGNIQHANPFF